MSSLETSVTLEDVFTVALARRVPLAPELAGYLTLEIADGARATGGEVEPRTVYISEEGTVALVRSKRDASASDVEAGVRTILARLLEASGSATPALSAAARRPAGEGLGALVTELEAALIPVNRAAGRRALARLAREVKRVTLGLGRNASMPSPASRPMIARREVEAAEGNEAAPKPPRSHHSMPSFTDEAVTAKRDNQLASIAAELSAPELINAPPPAAPAQRPIPSIGLTPPPVPGVSRPMAPAARSLAPHAPPALKKVASVPPNATPARRDSGTTSAAAPAAAARPPAPEKLFGGDEVESLLDSFEVSSLGDNKQMARDLKAIAGLDPTPPPPDAKTLAELTKDVGKGLPKRIDTSDADGVEDLLALADASQPLTFAPEPPRSPEFSAPPAPSPFRAEERRAVPSSIDDAPPPGAALVVPSPLLPSDFPLAADVPMDAPLAAARVSPGPILAAGLSVPTNSLGSVEPLAEKTRSAPPPPVAPAPAAIVPPAAAQASGRREKVAESALSTASTTGATHRRDRAAGQTTGGHQGFRQPRAPRTGLVMLVLTLLVLVVVCGVIYVAVPGFFTGNIKKKKPQTAASASASAVVAPTPRCKVALVVNDAPTHAEILLRMGQSPLDVERMPVGTRLEFVATAEGYAPRRAIVKAESPWDKGPDGKPRIDVPIQLDPSKAKPGAVDPWPAAEPGSQVGGSGAPGTVHVVSNVRGAEVWLLAGLGPEARIEQLRCDADIDILLAGPPTLRKRLHVGDKDIAAAEADAQGNKVVTVTAK